MLVCDMVLRSELLQNFSNTNFYMYRGEAACDILVDPIRKLRAFSVPVIARFPDLFRKVLGDFHEEWTGLLVANKQP